MHGFLYINNLKTALVHIQFLSYLSHQLFVHIFFQGAGYGLWLNGRVFIVLEFQDLMI